MSWPLFLVGLLVVVLTSTNVLFTMVLPRRPFGIDRFTLVVNRVVLKTMSFVSHFFPTYEWKDAVLSPMGPIALVLQLLLWAGGLILGFGLLIAATGHSIGDGLLQAMTSLFTVGSAHEGGVPVPSFDVPCGAIWVVIVALQIAYLPTLYSAFSRRESLVALLEGRASVPAWGPEILIRHQLVGIVDALPDLYSSWEAWSADVAESHTTYPVLLLFRSPEAWYSWIVSQLAVLDAAAIHLAIAPSSASSRARLCLRMGFTLFDRIALSLGWDVDPDPDPEAAISLTFEEYAQAIDKLAEAGFPMERSAEESWPDFRGWRVNYEVVAYRLADRLTAPPAPWSGPRHHLRSGPVLPKRPPQRHPGEHPTRSHAVVGSPVRRVRSSRRPSSRSREA
ncbi:MAG: hypothetical protein ACRDXC_05830 [Acidimicrobiales bacterium]